MSRVRAGRAVAAMCFPRVSGDEPTTVWEGVSREVFSPRERG